MASSRGDRSAYAGLVRRHYNHVFLVCLGVLGNVHDAEDVAQEAMLKGFERIRQLRAGAQFGGWVVAIARNLSINQLRKRKTAEKAVSEWSVGSGAACVEGILPSGVADVPSAIRRRDAFGTRGQDARDTSALEDLQQAVARLPWDLRLPLVMYYFDGQDVKAVAERLDISTSGVYLKLRTAIKELHDILTMQGDTP